jgi:glycosyltransferase involved in cell wall biosynthesis
MKLIIQIPCWNEEHTLPQTLAELPRHIEGIDEVEWLVIDDGSTDRTVETARANGVDHIVSHTANRGLATTFQTGINACLQYGADIIVNTDADNQYPAAAIPSLIQPILRNNADMVIGDRQVAQIAHFSGNKKRLQNWGSAVVRHVSQTDVPDAPSGFRAFSRETALRLNVVTGYTYTLETIIQAGKKNLKVVSVPVTTNPKTRESRLIRSIPQYVLRSAFTILRLFVLYEPLRTFTYLSLPFALVGLALWAYYGTLVMSGQAQSGSNVQSVVVGAALIMIAFLVFLIGLVGELIAINRRLQEETLYYVKKLNFSGNAPSRRTPEARDYLVTDSFPTTK